MRAINRGKKNYNVSIFILVSSSYIQREAKYMNEALEKAQDIFLEKINKLCREFGLNNIMAQLYAILYMSNKTLSLDDMVERLKISKGSASVNIRVLERDGIVRRVWVKGSRKDYYEAEMNIAKVMLDRIRSMASRRILEVGVMLSSTAAILDSTGAKTKDDKESIELFRQRLETLKGIHARIETLFNLFNSGIFNEIMNNGKAENEIKELLHAHVSGGQTISQ